MSLLADTFFAEARDETPPPLREPDGETWDPTTPEHDDPTNGDIAEMQLTAVLEAIEDYCTSVEERGDWAVGSIYRFQDFRTIIDQIVSGEDVA